MCVVVVYLPGSLPPIIDCMVAPGSSLLEPMANSPPPKVKVYGTTSAVVWEKNSPLAGLEPTSRPGVYNPVELPTELRVLFPEGEREIEGGERGEREFRIVDHRL